MLVKVKKMSSLDTNIFSPQQEILPTKNLNWKSYRCMKQGWLIASFGQTILKDTTWLKKTLQKYWWIQNFLDLTFLLRYHLIYLGNCPQGFRIPTQITSNFLIRYYLIYLVNCPQGFRMPTQITSIKAKIFVLLITFLFSDQPTTR